MPKRTQKKKPWKWPRMYWIDSQLMRSNTSVMVLFLAISECNQKTDVKLMKRNTGLPQSWKKSTMSVGLNAGKVAVLSEDVGVAASKLDEIMKTARVQRGEQKKP